MALTLQFLSHVLTKFRRRRDVGLAALQDKFIIGHVGRLDPVKNQVGLIDSVSQLLRNRPQLKNNLVLAIIGEGGQYDAIRERAEITGISENCWLPGGREDIANILGAFDIYVQPSFSEGISNTVLEAMACGLPVIATEVGGNSELVVDQGNGLLVSPGDDDQLVAGLLKYIENPDLRTAHGAASRERASTMFEIEGMVDRYDEIYAAATAR